jgi:hypothetical protein
VAYCSIMTLLLAFFIILQAFATEQQAGLFYAGQGSFVRALETFGLGGLWDPPGARALRGESGPRYMSTEGQEDPPDERRIDPEMEEAQRALEAVSGLFDVQDLRPGSGWRVSLPTPFSTQVMDGTIDEGEEAQFCQDLARRVEPLMLARGFVIRVGTVLHCTAQEEPALAQSALAATENVRQKLLAGMSPAARQKAAGRMYSFCRRDPPLPHEAGAPTAVLRIDLLLTKPYADRLRLQETRKDGTP